MGGKMLRSVSELIYKVYARYLLGQINLNNLPGHVALIVDGNRRWARKEKRDRISDGHRAGAGKAVDFLHWCDELDINIVTLYLLSNDNLKNRNRQELNDLVQVICNLIAQVSKRWKVNHVGSCENLPELLGNSLEGVKSSTKTNRYSERSMTVNLAIGYSGRAEITEAVRKIVNTYPIGDLPEKITEEVISANLYTGGLSDPDLIIRTSGEQRLSDFMPWQSTHSEFYFLEALGPDLRKVDFLRAIRDFSIRRRSFGA
ncbi:isoprenyl transferase [Tropheryma whipplei]|uniref:Isoprenyl transferase 1 n=1 Tax=Tropheryma whipplei (strain TW08/27) TaxID=218496 RepID=ISPT1_TROW8|nr:isoprenyl transferase [Tropheryma whipplei]Q83HR7.1 RecName: Full=Isoprenyl transferase 1 [Tropheryma whipplei TW08/27]CAD67109.1 undecaprenyl pyrophosphate synthetase [Tropheryma whipplei TW08/27]